VANLIVIGAGPDSCVKNGVQYRIDQDRSSPAKEKDLPLGTSNQTPQFPPQNISRRREFDKSGDET